MAKTLNFYEVKKILEDAGQTTYLSIDTVRVFGTLRDTLRGQQLQDGTLVFYLANRKTVGDNDAYTWWVLVTMKDGKLSSTSSESQKEIIALYRKAIKGGTENEKNN